MNRAQRMQNRDNAQALAMVIEEVADARAAAQLAMEMITNQLINNVAFITPIIL